MLVCVASIVILFTMGGWGECWCYDPTYCNYCVYIIMFLSSLEGVCELLPVLSDIIVDLEL